jgi:hypothetical protein
MLDDLAVLVETEDIDARPILIAITWPLLVTMEYNIVALGDSLQLAPTTESDAGSTARQLHSADAATLLQFTFLDRRMPVRQRIEATDQPPHLVNCDGQFRRHAHLSHLFPPSLPPADTAVLERFHPCIVSSQ